MGGHAQHFSLHDFLMRMRNNKSFLQKTNSDLHYWNSSHFTIFNKLFLKSTLFPVMQQACVLFSMWSIAMGFDGNSFTYFLATEIIWYIRLYFLEFEFAVYKFGNRCHKTLNKNFAGCREAKWLRIISKF